MSRQLVGLLAFSILASLATACSRGANVAGSAPNVSGRFTSIVNGKPADGTEGWAGTVVGLGSKSGSGYSIFCTGTLLDTSTVVTAAHCAALLGGETYVVFGLNESGNAVQGRRIVKHLAHEKFNPWFPDDAHDVFDIGIARFEGDLPAGYHPAELLADDSVLSDNAEVLLAGYGVTNGSSQTGSGLLRYVTVKIHNAKYGESEIETDEAAAGSCNGDSGGPGLVAVNGKYYLWGTTSRGDDTCTAQGIYTKVTYYKNWIQSGITSWNSPSAPAPAPAHAVAGF